MIPLGVTEGLREIIPKDEKASGKENGNLTRTWGYMDNKLHRAKMSHRILYHPHLKTSIFNQRLQTI